MKIHEHDFNPVHYKKFVSYLLIITYGL